MKRNIVEFWFKISKILLLIIILFIVCLGVKYRNVISVDTIINFAPQNLIMSILFIMLCFAIKSISVAIPIISIFIVSGHLFNIFIAFLVNCLGIIICVTLPYFIGHLFGKDTMDFVKRKYKKVEKAIGYSENYPVLFSYVFRALGVLPGDVVSLVMGAISLDFKKYLLGSFFGMFPVMLSATILGDSIKDFNLSNGIVSASIIIISWAIAFLAYRLYYKKK